VPKGGAIKHLLHRLSPLEREQGRILRRFYDTVGFVHFGHVHQHDDEYDAIRGFTASLTHHDENFAVGSYDGYDVRVVNRADTRKVNKKASLQLWTIIEVSLRVRGMPHIFFMPTDQSGGAYEKLFAEQPYMQPISSYTSTARHSPEFHGRYQILARSTRAYDVDDLITTPIIAGISSKFWPHGIEVEHGRLYIYIPDRRLTKQKLEHALSSALWLANSLREAHDDVEDE
jgi:hypothetical protein